jgi:hypothetical protein
VYKNNLPAIGLEVQRAGRKSGQGEIRRPLADRQGTGLALAQGEKGGSAHNRDQDSEFNGSGFAHQETLL